MPSLQSKAIVVLLCVMGWKRKSNRMRERVESGDRTYTEPSRALTRRHRISNPEIVSVDRIDPFLGVEGLVQ